MEMVFTLRRSTTAELSAVELRRLRRLLDEAYDGEFSEDDWRHCLGGLHVLGWLEGDSSHTPLSSNGGCTVRIAPCVPGTSKALRSERTAGAGVLRR
jgi:hypothetical protein